MPTLKGLAKRLSDLRGQFYVDLSSHHRDSVLICTIQRSGSTWFGEVINYANEYRSMYEPFHNRRVPEVKAFKIWQYLRPDDDSPEYLKPATAIFEGRIRNASISALNRRVFARRRLIKEVRSLMMIGWIRAHFPEMPVILLLRHPCAVLNSLLKLHWHRSAAENIFSQPQLMEDHLEPFRADIEAATGDVDNHLIAWCANYYVALRQLAGQRVFVAFYERFLSDPRNEIARLFAFLDRPFDERVFQRMKVPSIQARVARHGDSSAIVTGGDLLDEWRKHITPAQIDRAMTLLERFGLDAIYGPASMPRVTDLSHYGILA
jgi:hypothetical protein